MQSVPTYHYLPLKQNQIRVLCLLPLGLKDDTPDTTIECKIMVVSLYAHDRKPYEGVSYVWGDPKQTETITVLQRTTEGNPQSCIFPVTLSLWEALSHLRYKTQPRFLWVDQICINQDDTPEKNAQVGRMGEIYSRATCTVVWLGPERPDTELLKDMYRELSTKSTSETGTKDRGGVQMLDQTALAKMLGTSFAEESSNMRLRDRRDILLQFLNLRWFTRAWVYQEAVTAPKVDVVWGKVVLPFDFVTGLVVSAYAIAKGNDDRRWHRRIKSTRGFSALHAIGTASLTFSTSSGMRANTSKRPTTGITSTPFCQSTKTS